MGENLSLDMSEVTRRPFVRLALTAALLALAPVANAAHLQEPGGPPKGTPASTSGAGAPKIVEGVASLKLAGNRDWTSTGLHVRKGDLVRVKAWGRIRVARADGSLADPGGLELPKEPLLVPGARAAQVIAVVGDDNNDYVAVGRGLEFRAAHDGIVYLAVNQLDTTGNTGDFDVRVSIGSATGLAFGGPDLGSLAPPDTPPAGSGRVSENEKLVTVQPRLDWTNTYMTVKRGDTIVLEASGSVTLDLAGRTAGPSGIPHADAGKLIADKPTGALIAVVGVDNNDFLFVGTAGRFVAERTGLLFLGVNEGDLTNNSGSFSVRVRIERAAK
jgi:hypothetical protein